jgi:hypothetical protein
MGWRRFRKVKVAKCERCGVPKAFTNKKDWKEFEDNNYTCINCRKEDKIIEERLRKKRK